MQDDIQEKTQAELSHERAEAIIERNTAPFCIVCHQQAQKEDRIDTIHGPYHSWCVEGRE